MTWVRIVNIVPAERSDETNLDWNPTLAVNPADPNQIAVAAYTPPLGSLLGFWPIYYSQDRGETWQLTFPAPGFLLDHSVAFASSGELYRAVALLEAMDLSGAPIELTNPTMYVVRTSNPAAPGSFSPFDWRTNIDQPYVYATTEQKLIPAGGVSSTDHLFIGYDDRSHEPHTATVDVCVDARAPKPVFTQVRLDSRPAYIDGYEIRPTANRDGTVYVAYKPWLAWDGNAVTADIVVSRDDNWGMNGFNDLKDPADGKAGRLVAAGIRILDPQMLGEQRVDNDLFIAVDPTHSEIVYLVWGDNAGAQYTLRVRRSLDRGNTWSGDLMTVADADLACLAVNTDGRVGFMYQQLDSSSWVTHLRRTTDNSGYNWDDLVLARTAQANDMMADYSRLLSVGKGFFGVFPAWNTPDPANFPSTPATLSTPNGAKFLRYATKTAPWQLLNNTGGIVQGSVDPFFFRVEEDSPPEPPDDLSADVR